MTEAALQELLAAQVAADRRGDHDRAAELLNDYVDGLRALDARASDPRWGEAELRRILWLQRTGRVVDALRAGEGLVERAGKERWHGVLLPALRRLGYLAAHTGDQRRSVALLERALALARELGDTVEEAEVLRFAAPIHMARGDPERCLVSLQRSRELMLRAGADPVRVAQVDTPLAGRLLERGDFEGARLVAESSLATFEEADHAFGQMECLVILARICQMRGSLEMALELVRRALDRMRRTGDPRGLARCGNRLGELLRQQGDLDAAEAAYDEALGHARAAQHQHMQVLLMCNLAQLQEARGEVAAAQRTLEDCLASEGLQRPVEAGIRVLRLSLLEAGGHSQAWEEEYELARLGLQATDRFQRDVALAARRSGERAAASAQRRTGRRSREALSRAVRSHALAWHHWRLLGFAEEEAHEEQCLDRLGLLGATVPLGEFDIHAAIGKGGMGEVWRGVHRGTGQPVAIKVLTTARARNELVQASFRAEVRSMAALDHPNVVLVLGQGTVSTPASRVWIGHIEAGSPYLVMELAEGGTLETRCGHLAWSEVREVLVGLLDGLAHAHSRSLLHRDLKPANVLLGPGRGYRERVRLTDFGLAAAVGVDSAVVRVAAGTPGYMAPEQFLALWRDQGPWTDLYALGCLATELVRGLPPFVGDTAEELGRLHLTVEPPPLRPVVAVPPGFEAWISRLLQKVPAHRFQRAVEAKEALLALGEPILRSTTAPPPVRGSPTVSASTLFLEPVPAERSARQEATPPPVPWPATPEDPPRDHAARSELRGAGLSLFGLRVLPLVGREPEMARLWALWREVCEGRQSRAAILRGPAGIGRTRLARWLAEHAHGCSGAEILWIEHTPESEPGDGVRTCLRRWWGVEGHSVDAITRRLQARPELEPLTLAERQHLVTFLAADPDAVTTTGVLVRLGEVVVKALTAAGQRRPLLVVLDDAHWVASTPLLASGLLGRETAVLALATLRDDAAGILPVLGAQVRALGSRPGVETLRLAPLPRAAFRHLVEEHLGLSPDLAHSVVSRAGGHPDFAVQLVADWLARGLLQSREQGLALRTGATVSVPDGLHAAWALQVDRLEQCFGHEGRAALEVAAVIGRRVQPRTWQAACEAAGFPIPAGLPEHLLEERLAEPAGSGGWTFCGAPLRECLERIAEESGRLGRWHRACAEALPRRPGSLARRGRHLVLGGRPGPGLEALLEAAQAFRRDRQFDRSRAALALAQDALDALGAAQDDPRRVRWSAMLEELRADRDR